MPFWCLWHEVNLVQTLGLEELIGSIKKSSPRAQRRNAGHVRITATGLLSQSPRMRSQPLSRFQTQLLRIPD